MEAPPSPQPPLSNPPPPPTTTTPPPLYPGSTDSSPRSRHTDSWDADPSPPPKLRVMCSYGGHIVPRPHDKTLCYIGGDTRIIVIDRRTSLSDLHRRLSKNLLHNQQPSFSLKYQLPNEDLDSLISISTDEDLENMVEEYDRLNNGGQSKTGGRLRLFLFPKTLSNIEALVETASIKSEDWFLDALNGKSSVGVSDREFSESSSVNNLLGLDDDFATKVQIEASPKVGGGDNNSGNGNGKYVNSNQELNTVVPDSPMLERTSSFGSTSSSPSTANLRPIKVRVRAEENPKVGGFEEQFQQQMSVGNVNLAPPLKGEDVGGFVAAVGTVVSGLPVTIGGGEYGTRIFSDDERSDHGGYRKVQQIQPQVQAQFQQQQQQIPQFQQIPSPDSVSSEGSITNPLSRQRQAMYQEQFQSGNTRFSANQVDPKSVDQNNTKIQNQPQVQESNYVLSGQFDQNHPHLHQQQQFIHAGAQYIPTGAMPIPSYYPMYHPSQQQPVIDQNYPVYPLYYPSTHPQTRSVSASKPEMAAGMYRTSAAAAPQLVQAPSNQHQAQYVGYNAQFHHPSQSMNPPSAGNSNYTYEFADPNHAQMYYTHLPPQMAAQYQTMSSAGMPDGSAQLPTENIRTSQP